MRILQFTLLFILLPGIHRAQEIDNQAIRHWEAKVENSVNDSSKIMNMIELSETLFFFGRSAEAAQLDTSIYELSELRNFPEGKVRALLNFSRSQVRFGNFDQAMHHLNDAHNLAKPINYQIGLSLIQLNRGGILENTGERDTAKVIFNQALKLVLKINYHHGIALAYNYIGMMLTKSGKPEESLDFFRKSIEEYALTHKEFESKSPHSNIGQSYDILGNQEKAFEYYYKALDINMRYGNILGTVPQLNNIGVIYENRGDLPRALEYYQKTLDILEEYEDFSRIYYVYGGISKVYSKQKKYDLAMEYMQKAVNMGIQQNNNDALYTSYNNIGDILGDKGDYKESTTYFKKAIDINNSQENKKITRSFGKIGDNFRHLKMLDSARFYYEKAQRSGNEYGIKEISNSADLGLAKIHFENRDFTESYPYAIKAFNTAEELTNRKIMSESALLLSKLSAQKGEFKKAYWYHETYSTQKDSLLNESSIQRLTELQMQYEFDREKKDLKLEQEKKDLEYRIEIQHQRMVQYASFGSLALIIVVAFFFYRSFQMKKRDNLKILEQSQQLTFKNEQLEELSSFKEGLTHMIAHDMKNSLNVILGLSENESEEKMKNIHHSGSQLLRMVLNMLDIQKFEEAQMKLNPKTHGIDYITKEALYQVELHAYSEGVTIVNKIDQKVLLECNEDLIVRVLVNLLTNAIKYSDRDSKVILSMTHQPNEMVSISIRDFGGGIPEEDLPHVFEKFWQTNAMKQGNISSTGLGLTFCKLAIEAHGGEISVSSENMNGTDFFFTVPTSRTSQQGKVKRTDFILHEEKIRIETLSKELRVLEVYQAGEIFKILSRDDARDISSLWANELRSAVEQSDEEKFRELVNLA